MLLHVREAAHGLWTGVDTREIARTSRMVSRLTGYQVQPNKAIVGRNAFAHESGIHQDGVLKERTTYEIMDATTIGLETNSLVLGKHSGRHALRNALEELGFKVDGAALNTAFKRFKELADKKKKVTALDLEAIVSDEMKQAPAAFELVSFDIEASSTRSPLARVSVRMPDGEVESGSFTGDGPVDAFFSALNAATGHEARLREYHVSAVTGGRDALGEVTVLLELRRPAGVGRRACRPTSSRPRARPTCARSRTRSRTTWPPRPSGCSSARRRRRRLRSCVSRSRRRVCGAHERTHARRRLCPRPPLPVPPPTRPKAAQQQGQGHRRRANQAFRRRGPQHRRPRRAHEPGRGRRREPGRTEAGHVRRGRPARAAATCSRSRSTTSSSTCSVSGST